MSLDLETIKENGSIAAGDHVSSGGDDEKQSCRVYVGNLSWEVSSEDLKEHMRDAGNVTNAEVMTVADGRSKGCGIVEYSTPEEAKEACDTLGDTEVKGRMIFVREDRGTSSGRGRGEGGQHNGESRGGGGASVFVGNLAYETSWQDLKDHMRQAGNVAQVCAYTELIRTTAVPCLMLYKKRNSQYFFDSLESLGECS